MHKPCAQTLRQRVSVIAFHGATSEFLSSFFGSDSVRYTLSQLLYNSTVLGNLCAWSNPERIETIIPGVAYCKAPT